MNRTSLTTNKKDDSNPVRSHKCCMKLHTEIKTGVMHFGLIMPKNILPCQNGACLDKKTTY